MKKERRYIAIQLAIETTERALPLALKVMGKYADKLGWKLNIAKTSSIAKNREEVLEVSKPLSRGYPNRSKLRGFTPRQNQEDATGLPCDLVFGYTDV